MIAVGALALAAWLVLVFGRGGFWLARERDYGPIEAPAAWPDIVAIVPARDEAEGIERAIASLAAQDYPGSFRVVLVDDGSSDGTAGLARKAGGDRLTVIAASPLALSADQALCRRRRSSRAAQAWRR